MTLSSSVTLMVQLFVYNLLKPVFIKFGWWLISNRAKLVSCLFTMLFLWYPNIWLNDSLWFESTCHSMRNISVAPCAILGPAEWRLKSVHRQRVQFQLPSEEHSSTILVLYSSASSPGEFPAIMSERWAAKAESESPGKQDEPSMAHRKTVAHSSRQWIEGSRTDKKDYAPWSSEEQQYIWPPDNTDSTREVERVSREEAVYVVHI